VYDEGSSDIGGSSDMPMVAALRLCGGGDGVMAARD